MARDGYKCNRCGKFVWVGEGSRVDGSLQYDYTDWHRASCGGYVQDMGVPAVGGSRRWRCHKCGESGTFGQVVHRGCGGTFVRAARDDGSREYWLGGLPPRVDND